MKKAVGIKSKFFNKTTNVVLIVIVSSLIVTIFVSLFTIKIIQHRRTSQFFIEMETVDLLINQGRLIDASDRLKLIKKTPNGPINGISFIKRSWLISAGLNDFSLMEDVSSKVYKKNPNFQEIASFYVYALLRQNRAQKAYKIAIQQLKEKKYSSLIAESYLKAASEKNSINDINISEEDRQFLTIKDFSKDEIAPLIPLYKTALNSSNDIRLVKNLVLLYCAQGDYEQAFNIAVTRLRLRAPRLYLQVSYDAKRYQEAFSTIDKLKKVETGENLLDLDLIKADLLLLNKDYLEAYKLYENIIELEPSFSTIPYRNCYPIYSRLSKSEKEKENLSLDKLLKIYEPLFNDKEPYSDIYTSDVELLLIYIELLKNSNKSQKAKKILKTYISGGFEDEEVELMLHQLVDSSKPENYISSLVYLINKDPENELIPQTLCYYLIGFGDKFQLRACLKNAKETFQQRYWIDFYEGYLNLMGDPFSDSYNLNMQKTLNLYKVLYERTNKWEHAYNSSLIYYYLSDMDSAKKMALKADEGLSSNSIYNIDRSNIYSLLGKIFLYDENFHESIIMFEHAIEKNPSNIDALLNLKQLHAMNLGKKDITDDTVKEFRSN